MGVVGEEREEEDSETMHGCLCENTTLRTDSECKEPINSKARKRQAFGNEVLVVVADTFNSVRSTPWILETKQNKRHSCD